MVENEVTANNGQIEASRYIMLNARRQACKQINEMFEKELNSKKVCVTFRNTDERVYQEEQENNDDTLDNVSRKTIEGVDEGGSEQPNE